MATARFAVTSSWVEDGASEAQGFGPVDNGSSGNGTCASTIGSSRVSVGFSGVTTGSKTSSSTGSRLVSRGVGLAGGTTTGVCLQRDMGDSEASVSL